MLAYAGECWRMQALCRAAAGACILRQGVAPLGPSGGGGGGGGEGGGGGVCDSDPALQTEVGAEVDGRRRRWPLASEASAPTCSSAPTSELVIRACDFDAALLRLARVHRSGFEVELGGDEEAVQWPVVDATVRLALSQAIEWPLIHAQRMKALGVLPSRGVLLHGAPGCGKTSLVRAAASASGIAFLTVNAASLFSALLGESESILRGVFARARALQPCLLFLDEIDAIVARRSLSGGSDGAEAGGVSQRVLSTILNELDGIHDSAGVVLVGATNRVDMIDPALLRPGRFDKVVHVPEPACDARHEILVSSSHRMPLAADVDLPQIALSTGGFTGAELKQVVQEAALAALRADVKATHITAAHFTSALHKVSRVKLSQAE